MDSTEKILHKKAATITLAELEKICHAADYSDFVAEITGLIKSSIIRPMGKETNGKFPPLSSRYHICRPLPDDSAIKDEILRLGPSFNPSGYLSHIPLYYKHRELLRPLYEYALHKSTELTLRMSKNERAYAIWGNEKQLDDALCQSMLRYTGWESKLNYFRTPEPFLDYLCNGAETKNILILENKDIWFSLRKLFMENKTAFSLYNQRFDGILYGEGKKIARSNALAGYTQESFLTQPALYYWGDLDYEGIGIYLMICIDQVQLFVPGYMAMLEYAKAQPLSKCKTTQTAPPGLDEFLRCFSRESAGEIKSILEAGKYIPQEICNHPRLKANIRLNGY